MPLQNRVLPNGDIVAIAQRGLMTGNRGIIHGPNRQLSKRRWSHKAWICCEIEWQGRKRAVMTGRNWTELFFLDEAVAFAAGHRPCGYCRRDAYQSFRDAWGKAHGRVAKAPEMDSVLHAARIDRKSKGKKTYFAEAKTLPLGSFVLSKGKPHVVYDGNLRAYELEGYGAFSTMPDHMIEVLTPAPIIAVLKTGYRPVFHDSALPGG